MRLDISQDSLDIKLEGLEKVWAVKGGLSIPLDHVTNVYAGHPKRYIVKNLRLPGTFLPGVIQAGSYYCKRDNDPTWHWEFWYMTRGKETITIETKDEKYQNIILTVDDSLGLVDRIKGALGE